jgi:hypothetical protein
LPFARTVTDTEQDPFLTATTLLFLMRQCRVLETLIDIDALRGTLILAILAIVVRLTGEFLDTRLAIDCAGITADGCAEFGCAGITADGCAEFGCAGITAEQGTDIAAPTSHLLAAT